ncbi:hypothetical protein [Wolbachia endosymbiont (group B) of Limnophora tigrina]
MQVADYLDPGNKEGVIPVLDTGIQFLLYQLFGIQLKFLDPSVWALG